MNAITPAVPTASKVLSSFSVLLKQNKAVDYLL